MLQLLIADSSSGTSPFYAITARPAPELPHATDSSHIGMVEATSGALQTYAVTMIEIDETSSLCAHIEHSIRHVPSYLIRA
jgi:hypothetical protein